MYNKLYRSLVVLSVIFTGQSAIAHELGQPKANSNDITAPIYALFDGMGEHDQDKILAQFTSQALLQRMSDKGEMVNTDVKNLPLASAKTRLN